MNQNDEDARKVTEVLHIAYWNTFDEAVAAAHLRRVIDGETMAVYQAHTGGYVATPKSGVADEYKVLAIIDRDPPFAKPEAEPALERLRIERELAELRHDIDDISRRVKVLARDHVGQIKPEQQPQ